MSDDMDRDQQPEAEPRGGVIAPPPPPPAPPATGEQPRYGGDQRPRRRGGLVGGLVLIAVGLILLTEQLFPGLGVERLWPVILIVIGLGIIFRRR